MCCQCLTQIEVFIYFLFSQAYVRILISHHSSFFTLRHYPFHTRLKSLSSTPLSTAFVLHFPHLPPPFFLTSPCRLALSRSPAFSLSCSPTHISSPLNYSPLNFLFAFSRSLIYRRRFPFLLSAFYCFSLFFFFVYHDIVFRRSCAQQRLPSFLGLPRSSLVVSSSRRAHPFCFSYRTKTLNPPLSAVRRFVW